MHDAVVKALAALGVRSGKVKKLLKNYGFIADEQNAEEVWFFHKSNVSSSTFAELAVGDAVHFTLTERIHAKQAGGKPTRRTAGCTFRYPCVAPRLRPEIGRPPGNA